MKRSRIFLGATTTLLAIAGIAAAKAHRVPKHDTFYFTKVIAAGPACTQVISTRCTINGPGDFCLYRPDETSVYVLYSQGGGSVSGGNAKICDQVIKYNAN